MWKETSVAKLNLREIEARISPLGNRESYGREFIYELLLAFGKPKSSITRLKTGSLNVAADPEVEVAQKGVVYFRELRLQEETLDVMDQLRTATHVRRFSPRFIIVTDYTELLAVDTKTTEKLIQGVVRRR